LGTGSKMNSSQWCCRPCTCDLDDISHSGGFCRCMTVICGYRLYYTLHWTSQTAETTHVGLQHATCTCTYKTTLIHQLVMRHTTSAHRTSIIMLQLLYYVRPVYEHPRDACTAVSRSRVQTRSVETVLWNYQHNSIMLSEYCVAWITASVHIAFVSFMQFSSYVAVAVLCHRTLPVSLRACNSRIMIIENWNLEFIRHVSLS